MRKSLAHAIKRRVFGVNFLNKIFKKNNII
jgi:hypothetical protein